MIMFDYDNKIGYELDDALAVVAEDVKTGNINYVFVRIGDNILVFQENNIIPEIIVDADWCWSQVEIEYGVRIFRVFYNLSDINFTIRI